MKLIYTLTANAMSAAALKLKDHSGDKLTQTRAKGMDHRALSKAGPAQKPRDDLYEQVFFRAAQIGSKQATAGSAEGSGEECYTWDDWNDASVYYKSCWEDGENFYNSASSKCTVNAAGEAECEETSFTRCETEGDWQSDYYMSSCEYCWYDDCGSSTSTCTNEGSWGDDYYSSSCTYESNDGYSSNSSSCTPEMCEYESKGSYERWRPAEYYGSNYDTAGYYYDGTEYDYYDATEYDYSMYDDNY